MRSSGRKHPARHHERRHAFAPCAGLRRRRRGRGSGTARPRSAPGRAARAARAKPSRVSAGRRPRRPRGHAGSGTPAPPADRRRPARGPRTHRDRHVVRALRPGPARLLALISAHQRACPLWPPRRKGATQPMRGAQGRFVQSGRWRIHHGHPHHPAPVLVSGQPRSEGRTAGALVAFDAWRSGCVRRLLSAHAKPSRRSRTGALVQSVPGTDAPGVTGVTDHWTARGAPIVEWQRNHAPA